MTPPPEQREGSPVLIDRARFYDPLIRPGDLLQSSASRLAEWVRQQDAPYEVHMAALEAETASQEWTDARREEPVP
jgi:hypothetical protein